jgi:hypothetical protein
MVALCGCDGKNFTPNGNSDAPEPEEENPIPVLTSISPASCVAHVPAFEMTVEGSDFVEGANVVFRGNEMDTTFVDANHLTCVIQPDDTLLSAAAQAGHFDRDVGSSQAVNALVKVRNPSPGGGDSNTMDFAICENYTFAAPSEITWTDKRFEHIGSMFVEPEGRINVLYHRYISPEDWEVYNLIYLRQSNDGGVSWLKPLQITKNPTNAPQRAQFLVDSAGVMHSAHCRVSGYVYYHQSRDNGLHWTTPVELYYETFIPLCNWGSNFRMDVDPGGVIHILSTDCIMESAQRNVMYARSEDNGVHWNIRNISPMYLGYEPAIACDGIDRVYAVWSAGWRSELFICFRSSDDGGLTWGETQELSRDSQFNFAKNIRMAVNPVNHHIYLIYSYKNSPLRDLYRVYFRKSTDFGHTWSAPTAMTKAGELSDWGQIAVDSTGNINVSFIQDDHLFYRRSTDGGSSWTTTVQLPPAMQTRSLGNIAGIDETGNVYVLMKYYIDHQQTTFLYRGTPYAID